MTELGIVNDAEVKTEAEAGIGPEHGLRRQLGVWDLVLAQILCVVGSSWVGVAGGLGRAQSVMWVAAMAVFYLPMAATVVCLNSAMPLEGGLYVWARRGFGGLGGFLTAWNLWVYGVAVTATIVYAIPTELSYLIGPSASWLPESRWASLGIVALLVGAVTWAAVRGLELGKWIHNVGGLAILSVFFLLILLPLWGVWRGVPIHWSLFAWELPARNVRSLALFGQMLFGALCGLEYIAIFAGESRRPGRSIARSVWIASPVICAMFILGTSSVVAFAVPGKIDYIAPIPQTLRIALGDAGIGNVLAVVAILLVQVRLLGAASFLFTGVTRLPMTVGWDRLIPEWFTRMDGRRGTPRNAILFTAGLVMALVLLANVGVHAQEAYQLLSNASLTHYELTYLAMFAIPVVGAGVVRRALPGWLKWVSGVGFVATLFSLVISVFPIVDVGNVWGYAGKVAGVVVVSNLVALGVYWRRGEVE